MSYKPHPHSPRVLKDKSIFYNSWLAFKEHWISLIGDAKIVLLDFSNFTFGIFCGILLPLWLLAGYIRRLNYRKICEEEDLRKEYK